MAIQRTLVVIKPDGVQRALVGDIVTRFEKAGLKIVAMKLAWVDEALVGKHYADDLAYFETVWEKATAGARERGEEIKETAAELGARIRQANMSYLTSGPVAAMVLEGNQAIQMVRNIVGGTNPLTADMGTIRGDLTIDDFGQADVEGRAVRNLMHASSEPAEAEREIDLWFTAKELHTYQTVMDKVLHDPTWGAPKKK